METEQQKEVIVPIVEYDPGELPCNFLAMFWYALLAETAKGAEHG